MHRDVECQVETNSIPIEEKIRRACSLFARYGSALLNDAGVSDLLRRYGFAIAQSKKMMHDLNVVECCRFCATDTAGGGCCGAGIEDWYDEYLLLLNLMFGKEIPVKRRQNEDCLFLGTGGCLLDARHNFCANYLCRRILERLSSRELSALRRQYGKELFLSWELEQRLRKFTA